MKHDIESNYYQIASFYQFAIWLEGGFQESKQLYNIYYWWCKDRELPFLDYDDWVKIMKKHFHFKWHGKGKDKYLMHQCTYNCLDTTEIKETCFKHQFTNPLVLKEPLFNFVSQIHFVGTRAISLNLNQFRQKFAIPSKV